MHRVKLTINVIEAATLKNLEYEDNIEIDIETLGVSSFLS